MHKQEICDKRSFRLFIDSCEQTYFIGAYHFPLHIAAKFYPLIDLHVNVHQSVFCEAYIYAHRHAFAYSQGCGIKEERFTIKHLIVGRRKNCIIKVQ